MLGLTVESIIEKRNNDTGVTRKIHVELQVNIHHEIINLQTALYYEPIPCTYDIFYSFHH
jgi:hypothetical protein